MDQNREYTVSQLHDAVAIAIGPLAPMSDPLKFNKAIGFMGEVKSHFQDEIGRYKMLLQLFENYQPQLSTFPDLYELFSPTSELLEDVKGLLLESTAYIQAEEYTEDKTTNLKKIQHSLKAISQGVVNTTGIRIENCVGFTQVPVGLAGPLRIKGEFQREIYAPLATTEPTLVAACSRGCKVFQASSGVRAQTLDEAMSRAPVFVFLTVDDAVRFRDYVPCLESSFRTSAEGTSNYVRLTRLVTHIIGKSVHVKFLYTCGDAAGQNMVTIATQRACQDWMQSASANGFQIADFHLDGQMSSDKKMSWGNVHEPRGVQALAWGTISDAVCQKILGCTTARLYEVYSRANDGAVRNGQMGQNSNTANIMAALFIACGQDAASVLECGWSQLTMDFDRGSQEVTLSLYFPSVTVGTVGGGTNYPTQREALELIGCYGNGKKRALAETVAAFALALEVSTIGAIANDTFAKSHIDLARGAQHRH